MSLELVPALLVKRYLDESLSGRQCSFCAKRPDETLCAFIEAEGYVRICEGVFRHSTTSSTMTLHCFRHKPR